MSGWVKVMNSIRNHPKVLHAGERAFGLYIAGLCYSNEQLTDGFIPVRALPIVSPVTAQPKARAKELVEAGLWDEVDGGWRIHDYLDVQTSATKVRQRRMTDAQRKADEREMSKRSPNGHNGRVHAESVRTVSEVSES